MVVPWAGVRLGAVLERFQPTSKAKYVAFETVYRPEEMPGQRRGFLDWPYVEGLTIAEAAHELAFIATGYYGKPIPKQNGAPLRLAVPWKYGFKHVKGIVRFTLAEERPVSFWEELAGNEYGFWANVNPAVPHPRWSQEAERFYGPDGQERRPTLLYNGYAEEVAPLYAALENERLFM